MPPSTDDKESDAIRRDNLDAKIDALLDNEVDDHEIEVISDDDIIVSPDDINEGDFVSKVKTEPTNLGPTTVADGGMDDLYSSILPDRRLYQDDPHQESKQPAFRIMAALGTTKDKKNFYLLEKVINGMKARVFVPSAIRTSLMRTSGQDLSTIQPYLEYH